jgi:alpha-tubulin suppressor-like RCC1 family protein
MNRGLYGNGSLVSSSIPIKINNDSDWKIINYGFDLVCGVKTDGTLWAWGERNIGDGTSNSSLVPKQIGLDNQWVNISVRWGNCVLAIKTDGSIWTWGNGVLSPMRVGSDNDWKSIFYPYAIKSNGTLWSYGPDKVFIQVGGESDFRFVEAKHYGGYFAIKKDGTLWSYGSQIGTDNTWSIISSGYHGDKEGWTNSFGIKTNGTLWGVSQDSTYQLVNGTNWKDVVVEGSHITALKTDGTIYTWGKNYFGQLGNSTIGGEELLEPTVVNTPGCLASLDEVSSVENIFDVFPNPSNGFLTISINDKIIESISIKNTEGRTVLVFFKPSSTIDINLLQSGIYFLECNDGNSVWSKLIIKE